MNKGGFACLVDQQGGTAPQTGTLEHSPEQDLSRRNGVDNQNTIICNNMMHEYVMCFEPMHLAFNLEEIHLNQRFKCNSNLSPYICHLYVFTYTVAISWFVMHETSTDG